MIWLRKIRVAMTFRIEQFNHYKQAKNVQPTGQIMLSHNERIEIVTSGRGWYHENGKEFEITAGDLLWHVEGEYTISRSDPINPYHCIAVMIQLDKKRKRRHPRHNAWNDLHELNAFTLEIEEQFKNGMIPKQVFDNYVMSNIEYQISKSSIVRKQASFPQKLKEILINIEKHEDLNRLNIKGLATEVNWSVTHLHDTFKKHLNTTPYQYILKKKILFAAKLLLNTTEPIKRIAFDCGFSSSVAFCRCFKQNKGMTPASFRRKYA
jgi:AraC-like DNA-binding protein